MGVCVAHGAPEQREDPVNAAASMGNRCLGAEISLKVLDKCLECALATAPICLLYCDNPASTGRSR